MKIKTKLQLSAIFTVALTSTIGLIIFMAVLRVSEHNSQSAIASKIEQDVTELSLIIKEYLLYQGERQLIQQNLKQQSLSHNLAIAAFNEPDAKILVNDIRSNHIYLNTIFYELTTVNKKGQELSAEQKTILSERKDRLHGQILVKSQLMISDAFRVHRIITTKLNKTLQQTVLLISILLIIMILFVLIISFWIYKSIVPPIVRLEQGAQILGTGNLDHKVGTDSEDEIGQLSRSFDQMTGRLKETTVSRDLLVKEISERKRAEEDGRESEERFRTLANNISQLAWMADTHGSIFWYNQRWFDYTGTKIEEMSGWGWQKVHHPDHVQRVVDKIKHCFETGEDWEDTFPLRGTDGHYRWFLSRAIPIRDEHGTVTRWIGTNTDITERQDIEAGLEKTRKELAATKIAEDAAHEYSDSIINTVREPLLTLDSDLRVVKANRSFYDSFMVTPQKTIGNLIYDLGNRQWDIPKLRTLLEEILLKDNKFDDYEVEHKFSSIGHKIMLLNARRVTQKESGSQLILLAIEDVTDKMTLHRELAKRTREAESANRAKSDFLANMSHELRTPLNSIIGFSEILEDGIAGPIADKQKELANDISTSGRHLLSLINDILDLAKVEAGKMELELGEFNLEEIIDGSLVMFKEKAMKHNLKVAAEVEAEIGNIVADERKIKQVLFNLLSNALKFTPDGGAIRVSARRVQREEEKTAGRITLDAEPADFIEVCVADTGIGISEEDQKMLFQPFQQIDSVLSRKYSGTGLGLNLCKKFVELHGGWIWVESEVDKGSKFVFSIPIKPTKVIL